MAAGRPTIYSEELAEEICKHIAGGKSLREYCREEGKPAMSTVCRWIVGKEEFWEQYAQAREAAGFAHADKMIHLAEMVGNAEIEPQAAKVMMDAYKWAAERMASKHHSPRQEVEHSGSLEVNKLSDEELAAKILELSK